MAKFSDFDIDHGGTECLLTEAQTLSNGNVLAAVETFDQKTGSILKVVIKTTSQDDFITLGVVGSSVGLIEREHVISFLHVQRTFPTFSDSICPQKNKFFLPNTSHHFRSDRDGCILTPHVHPSSAATPILWVTPGEFTCGIARR